MSKKVTTHAEATGVNFGTVGVVRDAKTGRTLATCDDVRPSGFTASALADAEQLAERNGWTVVGVQS